MHRVARWGVVFCLLAGFTLPAAARVHHNDAWARAQFAKAERTREALNGRPAGERTRREYQRAIDAYRRIYFGSPASSKADPSVVATAELMVEMGRRFNDNKILRGAVDEYRFLRKEYPGSKYRFEALFTIGEIYKDDLNDSEQARTAFEDFLHRYPRNRLADDARSAVKELDDAKADAQRTAQKGRRKNAKDTAGARSATPQGGSLKAGSARGATSQASSDNASNGGASSISAANPGAAQSTSESTSASESSGDASDAETNSGSASARRGDLPRVTGVRHWSTPDYTRVAIDVERDVKFDSQRIAHPDRIFFDLKDTRLASTLVGKTFDVDDGFLRKIRVAEFKPGRTRVVLEVDDLSSYDAFLLPNPYRLIIDIHGKQSRAAMLAKTQLSAGEDDSAAANSAADDADDAAMDAVAGKGQKKSEKEHAIVANVKPTDEASEAKDREEARLESLLPGEGNRDDDGGNAPESTTTKGAGVVKTTVALKGSNRTIPKTIVDADDDASPRSGTHTAKRQTSAGNSRTGSAAKKSSGNAAADDGDDTGTEEASASPSDVPKGVRGSTRETATSARGSSPSSSTKTAGTASRGTSSHGKKSRTSSSSASADDLADLEMREARPTAAGDRSLTRALGLKIGKIVIDAGHGGHDTGTIGPNGLLEKDLVLDVARRLGRLLEARLGAEVVYTRRDDTFVPLETRTAIANREQADLFISIHANSSRDSDARGVETYYLNFTSSPEALEVAARENAVSEKSIHELQDLVKKIALKDKIDESREFASDVQDSLYGGLSLNSAGVRNRGVKKAPFIVLIGANMPSILAEISFVSNPTDERKLEGSEQRQRIAESLYRGVAKYAGGLSGVKVASKIEKPSGQ
ncbi:MAG: N-acetylmuramoyl-L-alanine amidase [Terriglobales bacterium]